MNARRPTALFCFVLAAAFGTVATSARAAEPVARRIHVSGAGSVTVAPDVAFINLTIRTADDNLLRVREANDKAARAVVELEKKNGGAADDFQVSMMNLSLSFNKELNRQIYQVQREATVAVTDFSKLDGLLAELLKEPNVTVTKISFDTTKASQHNDEAMDRAVADARQRAMRLAALNNQKLGKAVDIKINDDNTKDSGKPFVTSVIPVVGAADRPTDAQLAAAQHPALRLPSASPFRLVAFQAPGQAAGAEKQAADRGKPFALGQIVFSVQVDIDFELGE